MSAVRQPAVAGSFYPADAREVKRAVAGYLETARKMDGDAVPKALVAPHAGYIYSGPIAGSAYVHLLPARSTITRVVLLGPAHRFPVVGLALPSVDAFRTPLGDVPLDADACAALARLPQVQVSNAAHALEHSLEVHLPFLQETLDAFSLVPLVVGSATPEQVAEVLESLWGGPETLVVVSSDLSHYEPYEVARKLDAAVSRAIEDLDPDRIDHHQACGFYPLRGLLVVARRKGLRVHTVDLRNSGDTAGPRTEVVGYGAYLFFSPEGHENSRAHPQA